MQTISVGKNMTSPIRSMTASAQYTNKGNWGVLTWEIRSLNHRFLDCSIHLPDFLSYLEVKVRENLRENLHRGRIDCYLKYQPSPKTGLQFKVNKNLLEQLLKSVAIINKKIPKLAPIDPLAILNWPHILQEEELNADLVGEVVLTSLRHALHELILAREREGMAIKIVMQRILDTITKEISNVRQRLPMVLKSTRAKIVAKLAEIKIHLDANRLEQETILFAQKTDISEELDRLEIHRQEFKRVLQTGGNVGKRLDFLAQELNREANTIASKSCDAKITQIAVEIKVLLEQVREQIQNIE